MKSFFGAMMLGCGILIAGLSGLCAMLFIAGALFDGSSGGANQMSVLPAVLLVAAVPLAIGIGLIFGGRAVVRSADADARGQPYQSAFREPDPTQPPGGPISPVPPAGDRDLQG
jgi:hypothetical protein